MKPITKTSIAASVIVFAFTAFADVRISSRITTSGFSSEANIYVKGDWQRTESALGPGMKMVVIEQCDRRKLIQINDQTKSYLVTSLDEDLPASSQPVEQDGGEAANSGGKTIPLMEDVQDTGERKDFFGYKARRLKTTISSASPEDSCLGDLKVASDGWYIDVPASSCRPQEEANIRTRAMTQRCGADVHFHITGNGRLGYPVLLDTTIQTKNSTMKWKQEATSISTVPVDAREFEVPSGYREVSTLQELMGAPGCPFAATMGQTAGMPTQGQGGIKAPSGMGSMTASGAAAAAAKLGDRKPGTLRIGIAQIISSANAHLATAPLQRQLLTQLRSMGIDAVPLSASPDDHDALEAESQSKQCDYFVTSDVVTAKHRGAGRTQVEVAVKAFLPEQMRPVLDGSNTYSGADTESALRELIQIEAKSIATEIRKVKK